MSHFDHHLREILGRPVREDHCVARTVFGLLACSVFVTLLVISVGGQYFAQHVSQEAALRWSRGEFFAPAAIELQADSQSFASRAAGRTLRTGNEKV